MVTIRMKRDHEVTVVEVERVSRTPDGCFSSVYGWLKPSDLDGALVHYTRADWEEVPIPVWRDVTAECVYVGKVLFWRSGGVSESVFDDTGYVKDGFRLRKVDGTTSEDANKGPGGLPGLRPVIIIEKRN